MNKIFKFTLAAAAVLGFSACSDDYEYDLQGEGKLMLSATFSNDVKVAGTSRATLAEELSASTIVWISSEKGLVRKYEGLDNVPADGIKLVGGNYVAEAWAGDSVSASFDAKYYKARAPFTITKGTTTVELACRIANVVASVTYDETVDEALTDYTLNVGHKRGSLDFVGREERKGYFMMPTGVTDLQWTLTGTLADGSTYTKSGTIENVQPTTEYAFHVKYTPATQEQGGAFVTIIIDESEVTVEDNILISVAPDIVGTSFDFATGIAGQPGMFEKKSVYITASTSLKNVVMASDALTATIGGTDVDIMTATETVIANLQAAGIEWFYTYDEANDVSNMKVNFNEEWLNTLTEGEYPVTFTITDANDKTTVATMPIVVTNAKTEAIAVSANAATTWATQATVTGRILDESVTDAWVEYRQSASNGEWIKAESTVTGSDVMAVLTGLTPGTTYEYRVSCADFESIAQTVTTESAAQLPNAGFENWQTSSSPYLIYASGESMFWDSGNHGSSTMNKNVTTPATSPVHSGTYSACLQSQFVGIGSIGKFAAGNIFIGKYLKTDGTDGILGWGRSFTSRPTALKGYVQYTPAEVSYESSDWTGLVKGDMDQGIIYIAILDASTTDYNGEAWPVVIKTKSSTRQLFDKNGSQVIAYGEKIFDAATDGMIEFEIPLEYYRTDAKACYIMLTCAASRGGDYFVGGSSVMYIDDFELVY